MKFKISLLVEKHLLSSLFALSLILQTPLLIEHLLLGFDQLGLSLLFMTVLAFLPIKDSDSVFLEFFLFDLLLGFSSLLDLHVLFPELSVELLFKDLAFHNLSFLNKLSVSLNGTLFHIEFGILFS
jgi:hypothetical protein